MPDQTQLEDLVACILTEANRLGADSAETAVSFSTGLSVAVRLGEIETLKHHRNRGLGVTVYFDQRKGSASTSDWKPEAIHKTVRAACDMAQYTATDSCAGLADPQYLAEEIPNLDLFHPWPVTVETAIDLAQACEAAALSHDSRIRNSEGGHLSSRNGLAVYSNSNGFCGGYSTTHHSMSCSVIAQDNSGMQRDAWYTLARDPQDLEQAEAIGQQAAGRALRRLGGRRLGTCQTPVLFTPEMARGIIGHFIAAIGGGLLYRQASFLLDHQGKQIFPSYLGIREQPHLLKALGSAPFDSEGVATQARTLVDDGVLQAYVLDSYSARRLGMETTGNAGGVHNVTVQGDGKAFAELLKIMDTGLLVTHLMGQGINLLTGDYSRGASGFWVQNGAIQYPVEEITIASNLVKMFRGISHVGSDVDLRGNIRCGSLLIEAMTVAGI